ncbi:hypothetical protein ZWY2020_048654 [Hordeum vulgare]|nr:hypothetical protein ZWY2020_048654 [Hordeum vulgare]
MDNLAIIAKELGDVSDFEVDGIPNLSENDVSDEEIEAEELTRRMWKDKVRLKRIKEKQQRLALEQAELEKSNPKKLSDLALRKKMARAQDGILKYMLKLMEVCNAQGFVYGIIPDKGKPVSGASENIRAWWKEKVKFDKNGPAAIAKYEVENSLLVNGDKNGSSYSSCDEYDVDCMEEPPQSTISKDDVGVRQPAVHIREENASSSGNKKRHDKRSTQTLPSTKETKKPLKRRKHIGQFSVDGSEVEGTQRNDNTPEVLSNAIPDMNSNQMELVCVADLLTSFNHVSTNGGALQHQGDVQGNFVPPGVVVNNYSQAANIAPSSIYMADQPLASASNDYANSWPGNTFQPNVGLGSIGFSSSSHDYQSSSAAKHSLPLSTDNHVPAMGTGGLNSSYSHHMAGSGNSTSAAGDTQQIMSDAFYIDPDDKFIGSSFDGLPLDLIGINSPIPDLDELGELLDDDDLMQYLGT